MLLFWCNEIMAQRVALYIDKKAGYRKSFIKLYLVILSYILLDI